MTLPSWLPGWARPRRVLPGLAGLVALALLAAYAPSKPLGDVVAGGNRSEERVEAGSGAEGAALTPEEAVAQAAAEAAAAEAARADNVGGASGRAGAAGPAGTTSTGGGGPANRNTYQGVTDKEITVLFAYQHEPCGQDPSAFINQALPNADPEASIAAAVAHFNSRPREALATEVPGDVLNALGDGYYGRKVKPIVIDDRGDFCPEQSRADAQAGAEKHKPFASIGGGNEFDDEMSRRRILRVTTKAALNSYFTSKRPYMWGPITGASDINVFLAGYVGRYLRDTRTINTGGVETSNVPRKFGLIYLDDDETRAAVDDLKAQLAKRQVSVTTAGYEPNLGTIGTQATNIILQMKRERVTSILMVMDPIAVQFMTQSADAQRYFPEWISNTYGLMDWSLGPRTFMGSQARNAFGISVYFPSRQIREEETEAYKAWTAQRPGEAPPGDWTLWYASIKLLFRGLAVAGPDLTPHSFEAGYGARCRPCLRGEPFLPLTGYGPGDYTAIDDAHRQRYDPNAPDYAAARSSWQNGQPPRGAYVYEDNGRRHTTFD